MSKLAALLISLFCVFAFISKSPNYKTHSVNLSPTKTPTPVAAADVESVYFDKENLFIPCPPAPDHLPKDVFPRDKYFDGDTTLKVTTIVRDAEKRELTYYYTISGGRIIGKGDSVVWNLSGSRPGKYTITVGVDDGSGVRGKTVTKEIELQETPSCPHYPPPPCTCPSLSLSSSSTSVKSGSSVIFEAKVTGGDVKSVAYNWSVSNGAIVEGQGTYRIKVRTNRSVAEKALTANVEIGGEKLCDNCPRAISESIRITSK